jgi:tRNA pseudouridine38-40 synthase
LTKPPVNEEAQQRIALTIEYDGSCFNGWQLQRGSEVNTVQSVLEQSVSAVAAAPVRLHCAGRTDSGVHATNQVVHFDSSARRDPRNWLLGCNANLPDSVVVKSAQAVAAEFHARFSALSRRYRYLIYNQEVRSSHGSAYLTWVRQPLDVQRMHEEAQALLGENDFSSFRAAACQSSTPMRHVDFVEVTAHRQLVVIDIQANAFLHHMVRNIVGALIVVGKGRCEAGWIAELLSMRDRTLAPDTAPAAGLYLVGVNYPPEYGLQTGAPGPVFLPG